MGIGGLAKTIVGFAAGVIGTQFIVTAPLPRFVVFFGATHAPRGWSSWASMCCSDLREFSNPWPAMAGQAVGNAVVGVVGFRCSNGCRVSWRSAAGCGDHAAVTDGEAIHGDR